MFVGAFRAHFRLPGVRNLKAKRSPLRSVKDRLRQTFRCAVSEVEAHDKWQRTVLGIAVVGRTEADVREHMQQIRRSLQQERDMQLVSLDESVQDFWADAPECDEWGTPPDLLFTDLD